MNDNWNARPNIDRRGQDQANETKRIRVFTMAGFNTAPQFMVPFGERLKAMLEQAGCAAVEALPLLPYGDWSRRMPGQLREIVHDASIARNRPDRSFGGTAAAAAVLQAVRPHEAVLLAGHSGGGIAALHAAALLHADMPGARIVVLQFGAPRVPVPEPLRRDTLFVWTRSDPVPRIGAWLGAKPVVQEVRLLGGHRDYFRRVEPFIHPDGRSNMDVTAAAVEPFVTDRLT